MRRAALVVAVAMALAAPAAAVAGHGHGKHKKGMQAVTQLAAIAGGLSLDQLKAALAEMPQGADVAPLLAGLGKADALSANLADALGNLQGLLKSGGSQSDLSAAGAAVGADITKLEKQGDKLSQAMDKLAANASPADLAAAQQAFTLLSNQLKQINDIKSNLIGNLT